MRSLRLSALIYALRSRAGRSWLEVGTWQGGQLLGTCTLAGQAGRFEEVGGSPCARER